MGERYLAPLRRLILECNEPRSMQSVRRMIPPWEGGTVETMIVRFFLPSVSQLTFLDQFLDLSLTEEDRPWT
jgi:hypothetical protein